MRRIDADELKNEWIRDCGNSKLFPVDYFVWTIDNAKTIGPVKHGRWIKYAEVLMFGGRKIECSNCGQNFVVSLPVYEDLYNIERYCRHCGAKMKEVKK